jgi:DNA-binding HxlR family transcriptional regulator
VPFTAARRLVLAELGRHWRCYGDDHGLNARELAARTSVPPERARRVLRGLLRDGLVMRQVLPHRPYDFPRCSYQLTAAGQRAACTVRGRHARPVPRPRLVLSGLTAVRR